MTFISTHEKVLVLMSNYCLCSNPFFPPHLQGLLMSCHWPICSNVNQSEAIDHGQGLWPFVLKLAKARARMEMRFLQHLDPVGIWSAVVWSRSTWWSVSFSCLLSVGHHYPIMNTYKEGSDRENWWFTSKAGTGSTMCFRMRRRRSFETDDSIFISLPIKFKSLFFAFFFQKMIN